MRILLFVLSVFLLPACSYLDREGMTSEANAAHSNEPSLENCNAFPYDTSDTPCNLLGWQSFAYQALTQTPKEHKTALLLLENSLGAEYKKLILLSNDNETFATRTQASKQMFKLSKTHLNSFGHFFYMLAVYTEHALTNEKSTMDLKAKLKKSSNKNAKLKTELSNAQSKIQAIIDIEKNINTN